MNNAVTARGLKKTFKVGFWGRPVVAVTGVDLDIQEGQVFGLVGPNGAGKSTTLKMLLGLVRPDGGTGRVLGEALGSRAARARLGYLPELPSFSPQTTAEELLDFHAALAGVPSLGWPSQRAQLLARVGLQRAAQARLRTYSKGMLQRAGLAVALVGDPALLVLDEPMSGLDPLGRHDVRVLIREEQARGRTVVFSSHVLSDVEMLCDAVAIIHRGTVFKAGAMADILGGATVAVEVRLSGGSPQQDAAFVPLGNVRRMGEHITVELAQPDRVEEVLRLALSHNLKIAGVLPRTGALEALLLQANQQGPAAGRISP